MIWDLPDSKHTWAFYYFLKRCGDRVRAFRLRGRVRLTVERR